MVSGAPRGPSPVPTPPSSVLTRVYRMTPPPRRSSGGQDLDLGPGPRPLPICASLLGNPPPPPPPPAHPEKSFFSAGGPPEGKVLWNGGGRLRAEPRLQGGDQSVSVSQSVTPLSAGEGFSSGPGDSAGGGGEELIGFSGRVGGAVPEISPVSAGRGQAKAGRQTELGRGNLPLARAPPRSHWRSSLPLHLSRFERTSKNRMTCTWMGECTTCPGNTCLLNGEKYVS